MLDFIIREGRPDDLYAIADLELQCFAVPWSVEAIREDLCNNPLSYYLVAEGKACGIPEVFGYVGIWQIIDEGHVNNVAVSPKYRRHGVGSALIQALIDESDEMGMKDLTLEVRKGNEAAIGLYRSKGFVEEGIRYGYYEDNGEDAIIMWLRR